MGIPYLPPLLEQAREFRRKSERLLELEPYFQPGAPSDRDLAASFDEEAYRLLNPDVDAAIEAGRYLSGYDHWRRHGWLENRGGGPPEPATDRRPFLADMARRAPGLNVYGNLSVPSGLGGVARGMATAAEQLGMPVNRIDIPPARTGLERPAPQMCEPHRANLITMPLSGFDWFLRAYGKALFRDAYNIGLWFWELPSGHSYWRRYLRYVDEIWVASEYNRVAFQCMTNLPVVRIPLLVDGLEKGATLSRGFFSFPENVCVFTSVFDVGSRISRKNPFCLIRAFRKEFGDSPKVMLFLKVWNSRADQQGMRDLEQAIQGAPNIRIYDGVFTEEEMMSLHRQGDCLVSPHRAEGFGLNIAESMYFGKAAIATNYSSNLDFMNEENGYLIDYRLTPLPANEDPYWKGAVWADPSDEHLGRLMRRVLENPEERERKGQAASRTIREKHSLAAVQQAVTARLHELGLDSPDLTPLAGRPRHPESGRWFPKGLAAGTMREICQLTRRPRISIAWPVSVAGVQAVSRTLKQILSQQYPLWELCICDDVSTSADVRQFLMTQLGSDDRIKILCPSGAPHWAASVNRAVELSSHDFVLIPKLGEALGPRALLDAVEALNRAVEEPRFLGNGSYTMIRKDMYYEAGELRQAAPDESIAGLLKRITAV